MATKVDVLVIACSQDASADARIGHSRGVADCDNVRVLLPS